MLKELIITGGLVTISVLILKYLFERFEEENGKVPDTIADVADEQLYVDSVSAGDVKSWFVEKNADKKYTNILFYPTTDKIEKFGLDDFAFSDDENYLVQAIFDSETDKVIVSRIIVYREISSKLAELLEKNNGAVILD